jgi:hypothetical protein
MGDGCRAREMLIFLMNYKICCEQWKMTPELVSICRRGRFTQYSPHQTTQVSILVKMVLNKKPITIAIIIALRSNPGLICTDTNKAYTLEEAEYPGFDTLVMIASDNCYGASGGLMSVFAAGHPYFTLHELGHTFADLADEYVDENIADRYSSDTYVEGLPPISRQLTILIKCHGFIG